MALLGNKTHTCWFCYSEANEKCDPFLLKGIMCDNCYNRREFLGAATAGGMLLASHLATGSALAAATDASSDWPQMPPAIAWAMRNVDYDVKPNIDEVTPHADQLVGREVS
jgi:hypothetical protein